MSRRQSVLNSADITLQPWLPSSYVSIEYQTSLSYSLSGILTVNQLSIGILFLRLIPKLALIMLMLCHNIVDLLDFSLLFFRSLPDCMKLI